jgi:hypothetical protein
MAAAIIKKQATKKVAKSTTKIKKGSYDALVAAAAFAQKTGLSKSYGK